MENSINTLSRFYSIMKKNRINWHSRIDAFISVIKNYEHDSQELIDFINQCTYKDNKVVDFFRHHVCKLMLYDEYYQPYLKIIHTVLKSEHSYKDINNVLNIMANKADFGFEYMYCYFMMNSVIDKKQKFDDFYISHCKEEKVIDKK